MKQFIRSAAFCCFFLSLTSISFPQSSCWSSAAGGEFEDKGTHIITDNNGNTYVAGTMRSGHCYFKTDTILTIGTNDMFIVKYDVVGNESWVMQLGGNNYWVFEEDYFEYIGGLVIDTIHNRILICGTFYEHLNLPDTTLNGYGLTFFVLSMDLDGNVIWARAAGGLNNAEVLAFDNTYDEQGCTYVSGSSYITTYFDGISVPPGGFLAKYDMNGNVIWAKNKFRYYQQWSGPIYPYTEAAPFNMIYSDGHLWINGQVRNDTIVIDTITLYTATNYYASYLSLFSEDGNIEWIKLIGGPHSSTGNQFAISSSSNIYIAGCFYGSCIFGNDTLNAQGGGADGYLSKVSTTGEVIWTINLKATSAYAEGLVCDANGNVYLSGQFYGTAQFGTTTISTSGLTYYDMFVASFSNDGICNGVRQYPTGDIAGLTMDNLGNICMTGHFYDSLHMGDNTIYSHGKEDFFTAKCSPITSTKESPSAPSNQLLIYANPTTGKCNITVPDELKNDDHLVLYIYDSGGRLIQKANIERTSETYRLDIRAQAAGVYQAVLTNGSRSYSGKIVFTKN